jgi:hypothetical protein
MCHQPDPPTAGAEEFCQILGQLRARINDFRGYLRAAISRQHSAFGQTIPFAEVIAGRINREADGCRKQQEAARRPPADVNLDTLGAAFCARGLLGTADHVFGLTADGADT